MLGTSSVSSLEVSRGTSLSLSSFFQFFSTSVFAGNTGPTNSGRKDKPWLSRSSSRKEGRQVWHIVPTKSTRSFLVLRAQCPDKQCVESQAAVVTFQLPEEERWAADTTYKRKARELTRTSTEVLHEVCLGEVDARS